MDPEIVKRRLEWMQCPDRVSRVFLKGVDEFLDFAFSHTEEEEVPCPCRKCNNNDHKCKKDIKDDLIANGIVKGYVRWIYHGEYEPIRKRAKKGPALQGCDDIVGMIHDALGNFGMDNLTNEEFDDQNEAFLCGNHTEESNIDEKIANLMRDANQELYPGCENMSKLSFILRLFQIKCVDGMTNKAFTNLLKLFKECLPEDAAVPSTYYEARNIIRDLGFDYMKIDACPNDCMLFWRENASLEKCTICNLSRWQDPVVKNNGGETIDLSDSKLRKIPAKVLRYFPIIPRLQRLFMSKKTASDMRWHSDERIDDGVLRHPADAKVWKSFDEQYPVFASDPRNARLGLASDGFNPYGILRSEHSTWPVVLMPYNFPPWKCMKLQYCMLSLLIPGSKAPGNNIDVYLQPLIDDLNKLWEIGINTYDASKEEKFQLHAALMWTVNDFPAYANLSGWSTKGYMACPSCHKDTCCIRLKNCHKLCYMGHRRFLPIDHKWRYSKSFDGKIEKRLAPKRLSGKDVLDQVSDLENMKFGKMIEQPKRDDNWRKKSIFFKLPYWSSILLRHNLDVMHIEKNVCDSVIGTLLDIEGKTKDSLKARHDLVLLKIRKDLQPQLLDGRWHIPPAPYTLSSNEKIKLCKFLEEIKVPDGYSSNFSRCINVKRRHISGLKTHDCHVLLEQLLPLAVRGIICENVYDTITELSHFFKELCSKSLRLEDLECLEAKIVVTLCKLEKLFLPSFFDIMVHLCIHLVEEAKLGGPVQYRWMYSTERTLGKLKFYVRNKSRPEGSIAEGYIVDECMVFCSKYLDGIVTKFNQPERNSDSLHDDHNEIATFAPSGIPLGKSRSKFLTNEEWTQARDYVLQNCDEVLPYLNEYEATRPGQDFAKWFLDQFTRVLEESGNQVAQDLKSLALGPLGGVQRFKGYIANGFRFHIKDLEGRRKNQNSGVMVRAETNIGHIEYYGVFKEIISLQYLGGRRVVLFKCDWWDIHKKGRGIKIDKHGFTSINTRLKLHTQEPYILTSQARQVFYVRDGYDPKWLVVVKTQPRHLYDMPERKDSGNSPEYMEAFQQEESRTSDSGMLVPDLDGDTFVRRCDIDETILQANENNQPKILPWRQPNSLP